MAYTVLEHGPDAEWRLIFALCRFGGFRCPSELLCLEGSDVLWDRDRIRIHSPKKEADEQGGTGSFPSSRSCVLTLWFRRPMGRWSG